MKIILGKEDIIKLIKEAYNGVNEVTVDTKEQIDYVLDVDGDNFYKKTNNVKQTAQTITPGITKVIGDDIDFEARVVEKNAQQAAMNASETTIPGVKKTIEQKNQEAKQKGLMTTGRGSGRVMKKF